MVLFFHASDVDHLISLSDAVQITENALAGVTTGSAANAPRKRLHLHFESGAPSDSRLNIYAGGSITYDAIGAQLALHRLRAEEGVQVTSHSSDQIPLAVIYEGHTGSLLAIMAHRPRHLAGAADLRTPATSLAGVNQLALPDGYRVGVYGAGHQAFSTLVGLTEIRRVDSAKVYSPTRGNRERFAARATEATGVKVSAASEPADAAQDVDVILCMTNAMTPVLDGRWLSPGQYIVSVVGSNIELVTSGLIPEPRREIDDETLRRCSRVIALSREQAIESQQGDIYWPIQNGVMSWDKVTEIGEVLAGRKPGRVDREEIILYKNQAGQGVIDLGLARKCYDLAVETGVGYELEIERRAPQTGTGWRSPF